MSDKIWSDGLTGEQIATVERAAKALWEATANHLPDWERAPVLSRGAYLASALAALRASGHPSFPPPKVPSRGEAVAERMLYLCSATFFLRDDSGNGLGMFQVQPQSCTHEERLCQGRKVIADAIDAERAAALDLAAKLVTDDYGSRVELAKAILALKGAAHV